MKITYTGRKVELAPAQLKKVEAAFGKVGKLLDGKEQREAHVVLSQQRHLNKVEVTVKFHGHELIGESADSDLFTALNESIAKLEKQAVKVRAKWRDSKRTPRKESVAEKAAAAAAPPEPEPEHENGRLIYHVNDHKKRKPMTLDEAIMEMDKRDYLVYRDSSTDRLSILIRRRDGHLDLVEA